MSELLKNTKCRVPSLGDIRVRVQEKSYLRDQVSNRMTDGKKKLDPLISKRTQFVRATSQLDSMRNSSSINESRMFNFASQPAAIPELTA